MEKDKSFSALVLHSLLNQQLEQCTGATKERLTEQYPNSMFTKLVLSSTITTKEVFPFSISDTN